MTVKKLIKKDKKEEKQIHDFISKGGSVGSEPVLEVEEDHRLTLRIPKSLLQKVDLKRKQRVGSISRNLWILEQIEKAVKR